MESVDWYFIPYFNAILFQYLIPTNDHLFILPHAKTIDFFRYLWLIEMLCNIEFKN